METEPEALIIELEHRNVELERLRRTASHDLRSELGWAQACQADDADREEAGCC